MPDSFTRLVDDCQAGLDLLDRQRSMQKSLTGPSSFGAGVGDLGADIRRSSGEIRGAAAGFRRLGAELRTLGAKVAATSAATQAATVQVRRDRLRVGMHGVMAKAMGMFEAGEITGHEVRVLEARINKIGQVLSL